jgi:hypothetical protein
MVLLVLSLLCILSGLFIMVSSAWSSLYERDRFNCVDMSYALAPLFRGLGFDTRVVYGSLSDGRLHCWLTVNGLVFESTTLCFGLPWRYGSVDFVDCFPWGYWDELGLVRG